MRLSEWTETQRIHGCNRTGPHREDIPQDASDSGCSALIWLDEAGVVVRFNLEGDGVIVPDVNDSCILTRPLQDSRATGREPFQMNLGTLVAAMFAPHHTENAQLQ